MRVLCWHNQYFLIISPLCAARGLPRQRQEEPKVENMRTYPGTFLSRQRVVCGRNLIKQGTPPSRMLMECCCVLLARRVAKLVRLSLKVFYSWKYTHFSHISHFPGLYISKQIFISFFLYFLTALFFFNLLVYSVLPFCLKNSTQIFTKLIFLTLFSTRIKGINKLASSLEMHCAFQCSRSAAPVVHKMLMQDVWFHCWGHDGWSCTAKL